MLKFREGTREAKLEETPIGMVGPQFASKAAPVLGYVAQLVPAPPRFTVVENWAAHKIMGMPLSLDTNAIFDLDRFGGVKLLRVSCYIKACRLRAATKTVYGYSEMFQELKRYAIDGLPVAEYLRGALIPPGWDGPSFATNLHLASLGLDLGVDQHASAIHELFLSLHNGGRGRRSVQAAFYTLLRTFYPSDWGNTLTRKINVFSCVRLDDGFFVSAAFQGIIPVVRKIGMRGACAIIKTWSNAWTTSSRMHEAETLPCVFGCGGVDSLEHYLCCESLWTIVISCSQGRVEHLHVCPATKLGFGPMPATWLRRLVVAFNCFHAIKMAHRSEIQLFAESGHPHQVHSRLLNYAVEFCRDFRWDVV